MFVIHDSTTINMSHVIAMKCNFEGRGAEIKVFFVNQTNTTLKFKTDSAARAWHEEVIDVCNVGEIK